MAKNKKTTLDEQLAKAIKKAQPKSIREVNNLFNTGSTDADIESKTTGPRATSLPGVKTSDGDVKVNASDEVIANFIKNEENKVGAKKKQSAINEIKRTNAREVEVVRERFGNDVSNAKNTSKPPMPNAFELASQMYSQKKSNSPYAGKSFTELTNLRKGVDTRLHSGKITQAQADKEKNTIDMWRVRSASKDELAKMRKEAEEYSKYYLTQYNKAGSWNDGISYAPRSVEGAKAEAEKKARQQHFDNMKNSYNSLISAIDAQLKEYEVSESYDDNLVKWGKIALDSGASDEYKPTSKGDDYAYNAINRYFKNQSPDEEEINLVGRKNYLYLQEGEIKLFNTLYNHNKKEAKEYLKSLTDVLSRRAANKSMEQAQKFGEEHPLIGGAASVAQNIVMGVPAAIDNAVEGVFGDVDTYDATSRAIRTSQALREGGSEYFSKRYGETGALLYNTGLSMVENLANILLFKGIGGAAGAGAKSVANMVSFNMMASAASNGMISAADRGGNDAQIILSGIANGAAEYIFEKISIDRLFSIKGADGWKNVLKQMGVQSVVEGSEEALTEIANILSDTMIMQGQSENNIKRREYVMNGMSAEEATKKVFMESIAQIASSAAAGAISGGIMGGGATVISNVSHRSHMNNVGADMLKKPGALNRLMQMGLDNNNTEAVQIATQLYTDGANINNVQTGKMVESVISDVLTKKGDIADIVNVISILEGRNPEYIGSRESIDTARAVMHFVNETATKEDTLLLEKSSGAVTLLTAIEGNTKAWNSVKTAAKADAEYRASRGFEEMQNAEGKMQNEFTSEQVINDVEVDEYNDNETQEDLISQTAEEEESTIPQSPDGDSSLYTREPKAERYDIPEGSEIVNNIVVDEHSKRLKGENPRAYSNIIRMARRLGMNVRFVKDLTDSNGERIEGIITSKGVFIDADAKNPSRFVATHEFGHRMKQAAPKEWAKYQEYVINKLKKESFDGERTRYEVAFEAKAENYDGTDTNYIDEEIAADYIRALFSSEEELENFIKKDKWLALKVRDMWYKILEGLGVLSEKKKAQQMWLRAYTAAAKNVKDGKVGEYSSEKLSIQRIVGEKGDYGIGVYLDSDLLNKLTEEERVRAVKEHIKNLGGSELIAYDNDGNPIKIRVAKRSWKYKNKNGAEIRANRDLTSYLKNEVKQEAIMLIDELMETAKYKTSEKAKYSHGWLDNYGKNNWDYWKVFIQEKNKTVWEATLNVTNSSNGEKILYDIYPIEMVEGAGTSTTTTTKPIVTQDNPIVNSNSMQNSVVNTQEGKKSIAGTSLFEIETEMEAKAEAGYNTFVEENGGSIQTFRPSKERGWLSAQWRTERIKDNKAAAKPLSEIADIVSKEFGIPISNRKFKDEYVTGSFNPTAETIHTRARTDVLTIAHEVGHLLDKKLNLQKADGIDELVGTLDRTLAALGYGDKAKKAEAVGEFVRMYLTNRETAQSVAPRFYAEFEKRLSEEGYKSATYKLADAVNAYLGSTVSERINLAIAGENDVKGIKQKLRDTKEKTPELIRGFQYEMIDRFHAIGEAKGRIYAKNPQGKYDPYVLATNSLNASARSAYVLTKAFVNMDGEEVGISFIECLKPIWNKKGSERRNNISLLNRYLTLKHALEWIDPKKKDGNTLKKDVKKKRVFADPKLEDPEVIREEIADMETKLPELKEAAENIYQYLRNLKKYWGVDMGLMTKELSERLDTMYPCYVPFFRESKRREIGGARLNLANQRAPIMEAHGGSELIVNPLESIAGLTSKYVKTASRNMAMQALAHMADNVEGSGFIIERAGEEQQKALKNNEGNNDVIDKKKESQDTANALPEELQTITIEEDEWQRDFKNGQGYVSVLRDGKKVWYQINDKKLFKAVADMEPKQMSILVKGLNTLLNVKKVLITSNNPLFASTNMVRDAITAYNNIDINNPFAYLKAYFTALAHVLKKDPNYKRWCAMGGGHGSELSSTMSEVNRALGKAMLTPGAKVLNSIMHPIETIASINDIVESTPRLMAFEHEMKKSRDVYKAIYKADDITTNFKRGGRTAKYMNSVFMFSNAAIQGLDRTIRSFTQKDTEHGRRNRVMKYAIMAVIVTVLQQAFNRRDDEAKEDYKNLSAYMKRSNYVINLLGGKFIRIPTAREQDLLRVVISDSVNYAFGDKEAFDGLVGFIIDTVWPWYVELPTEFEGKTAIDVMTDMVVNTARNTVVGTFTDFAANRNFTGSPIVPASYEDVIAEEQYDEKTSKLAVFLGKITHNSPFQIDYIINNNYGILGTINKSLFPMDAAQVDKSIGFKSRWVADSYYSTDVLNRIYTKRDAAEKTFKRFGTGKEAAEYEKTKAAADFVSQYNKAVKELPDDEKRAARKTLLDMMNAWGNGNSIINNELIRLYDSTGENLFMKMPTRTVSTLSGKTNLSLDKYAKMVENYTVAFEASLSSVVYDAKYSNMTDNEKVEALKKAMEYAEDSAKAEIVPDYELKQWEIDTIDGSAELIDFVMKDNEETKIEDIGKEIYEKSTAEDYTTEDYAEDIKKYTDKENGYDYETEDIKSAVQSAARDTSEYKKYKSDFNRGFKYDASKLTSDEAEFIENNRGNVSTYYADKEFVPEYEGVRHLKVYDEKLSDSMSLEEYMQHRAKAKTTAAMADEKPYMSKEELETYLDSTNHSTAMKAALFRAIGNKGWKNKYDGTKNP